jgi:hypothetical protein
MCFEKEGKDNGLNLPMVIIKQTGNTKEPLLSDKWDKPKAKEIKGKNTNGNNRQNLRAGFLSWPMS